MTIRLFGMVIGCAFLATSALSQDSQKNGKGAEQSSSGKYSGMEDDSTPDAGNTTKPTDELGGVSGTKTGAAIAAVVDAAKRMSDQAVTPDHPMAAAPAAAPEPVKQEIQAALQRQDEPAARQLMSQALKRYPNDPELRDARSSVFASLPPGKARAMMDYARAEVAKLFGRQWLPGRNDDEYVGLSIDNTPRTGTSLFKGGPTAAAALVSGYGYLGRGDGTRAEQILTESIRQHPDVAESYYARVMARAVNGDFKGADADSLKAVTLSREQPQALSQRASLMMQMGRREEAFAWANRAIAGDPKDADALAIRGRYIWRDQARPELALEDLKQAAQLDPGRYQLLYEEGQRRYFSARAGIDLGRGDYRGALADAERVIKVDAGNTQAQLVRALSYWKEGNPEEAIKASTLAIKADPKSTRALFQRALAMEALGQRDRAISDMARAASLNPRKYRPLLEKLQRAKADGVQEPIWPRESGLRTASN